MIPVSYLLVLASTLFLLGFIGVCVRKNLIVAFMCVELMLNAVNIVFVTFSKSLGLLSGQITVFFVMVVAAAEAAIGLAIILALFRHRKSVESNEATSMKG